MSSAIIWTLLSIVHSCFLLFLLYGKRGFFCVVSKIVNSRSSVSEIFIDDSGKIRLVHMSIFRAGGKLHINSLIS